MLEPERQRDEAVFLVAGAIGRASPRDGEPRTGADDVVRDELAGVGDRHAEHVVASPQRERIEDALEHPRALDDGRHIGG